MAVIYTAVGRRICYDDSGDGVPLLLLTGLGATRQLWARQIAAFRYSYRAIAIDNRDTGESDPEETVYTLTDLANDAVALLDVLGIARAHVLGISMGGFIALHIALNHPQRVDRLIIAAGAAISPDAARGEMRIPDPIAWIDDPVERLRRQASRAFASGDLARYPERLDDFAESNRGNRLTYDGVVRQLAASWGHDVRARLTEIAAPTLVIHGDLDRAVPFTMGEALAAGIPGTRLVVFPGVRHTLLQEQPEEFSRVVLNFLSEGNGA